VRNDTARSRKYGIRGIPTTVILKNGKQVEKLVGFRPKGVLTNLLNKHLSQ
jgi:thioredoxin 1